MLLTYSIAQKISDTRYFYDTKKFHALKQESVIKTSLFSTSEIITQTVHPLFRR